MYKIRHKVTGLYQMGGGGNWSKHGKSWAAPGHLKLHLAHVRTEVSWYNDDWKTKLEKEIKDWEIVEFTMESGITRTWGILEFYPKMLTKE